ncbi:hypothetical protein [Mesobacillus subterraneus]|uniref:Uncharacterized protein n=1 Tax=Mesobacillus subterraneus TaxID=285983 RepID=A0A0D6ZBY1_9BACI|nr:hypothetical protein [Mesobacillus subterraneus]KIY22566.1 hypothetical protein UB32_07805 [Mesobacillus subterraneus]
MNEEILKQILSEIKGVKHGQEQLEKKMEARFNTVDNRLESIEQTLVRMEADQPEDITALLKQINGKLEDKDYDVQALNKRVFKVESEIEKITQQ